MSLLQAIDALLAHVPDDEIIPYGTERRRQFDVLDRAVWVEACKRGLEDKLPPEEPDRPSLGLTHLPGGGYLNGDFAPIGVRWWTNHLLALRALAESVGTPEAESKAEQPAKPKLAGTTVPEAAERLERLRSQGQPWTSYGKLAEQFGCSSKTLYDAVRTSPLLQAWATRPGTVPRARSLTPVVTDATSQRRELDPADDAAIREYLERDDLTPDERAFFNGLSRDDQLMFLDDPDKHDRILGRRP
jgi:hypothetical protein